MHFIITNTCLSLEHVDIEIKTIFKFICHFIRNTCFSIGRYNVKSNLKFHLIYS